MEQHFFTIGGTFIMSVIGMLVVNAFSSGWRAGKITDPLRADLSSVRDLISSRAKELHERIDKTADDLQMRIEGGLRTIDHQLDEHARDDTNQFAVARREFGETGAAIREQMRLNELWGRDNFLLEKRFDEGISGVLRVLDSNEKIAVSRHETTSKRLDMIEKNGNGKDH